MSTYPARCVAKLERRTIPGEKLFPIYGEVPGEAGGWGPLISEGDQVTARVLLERAPSELAPDHPLSQAVAQAAGQPEIIGAAYWMDMALTNAAGIPTVVASVEKCVDVYLKAAEQLCN